jgi:hypothetical protein
VKKPVSKPKTVEVLPLKTATREVARFRKIVRATIGAFSKRIEQALGEVDAALVTLNGKKAAREHAHNVRDILIVLRRVDIKAAKGRRRDLKRIESAVKDMRDLVEGWQ